MPLHCIHDSGWGNFLQNCLITRGILQRVHKSLVRPPPESPPPISTLTPPSISGKQPSNRQTAVRTAGESPQCLRLRNGSTRLGSGVWNIPLSPGLCVNSHNAPIGIHSALDHLTKKNAEDTFSILGDSLGKGYVRKKSGRGGMQPT